MNKLKVIFKKIKFKLFALLGLLTVGFGCLISTNNSYAWFVNDEGNLQSSNLFNKENVVNGYWLAVNNGSIVSSSSDCYTNYYIEVNGQTQISAYFNELSSIWCGICFYDNNKLFISGFEMGSPINNRPITTSIPSNCRYIRISSSIANNDSLMVNFGSTPLPYEPYGKIYYNTQFDSPWKVNSEGNLESSNLFNASSSEVINDTENNSGVSFQFYRNSSKVFNVGNRFTTNKSAYIYYNVFRNLEVGKTYTFSMPSYPYFYYEVLLDSNIHYITSNGVLTLTLTEDLKNYDKWRFVISENISDLFSSFTIMINEGSVPFSYAPYGKVYYSDVNLDSLQEQLETFQDKYNLLDANYNELKADYENAHIDLDIANSQLSEYEDTIHQLNSDNSALQELVNSLRLQVEDNFTWQNLFFTMADTPFRVVANALGFNIFGINLFATFIGLTTTLAIIFLVKKFI